jgi:hypothetical protein
MRNFVPSDLEELKETWVSSDTGFDLYNDPQNYRNTDTPITIPDEAISSMIPPPSIKFGARDFDQYIDELISAIPDNPIVVFKILKKTIETHPYLIRKPVGFRSDNPFEKSLDRFNDEFRKIIK